VRRHSPDYEAEYVLRGWNAPDTIDRVYVNQRARTLLGWQPRYDFSYVIQQLRAAEAYGSALARTLGPRDTIPNCFEMARIR
jgi:nucleoside-diphosphate-sugar epimerase